MIDKRYYSEKKISSSESIKIFQQVMGLCMVIMCEFCLLGIVLDPSDFDAVELIFYVVIGVGGVALFVFGQKRKKLIKNCQEYMQCLEKQQKIKICDLSIKMGRSEEVILKELGELIRKQYLLNMFIDYSVNQVKVLVELEQEKTDTGLKSDLGSKNCIGLDSENVKKEVEDNCVLRVQEQVNGDGRLKFYRGHFEYVYTLVAREIVECYYYCNVMNIGVDVVSKRKRLVLKLVDGTELQYFFVSDCSAEMYKEIAAMLYELKENAPSMGEMGISEEDAIRQLIENREKSRSTMTKKIGKFISEYRIFKELNLFNKIFHVVAPVICLFLLLTILGVGKASDQDYIDCAITVVSQQLRSPSTAIFYEEEILDEDKYGRVLVRVCVEAQNGFGGYIKNTFLVVITDYDNITEAFIYGNPIVYDVDEEWLEDGFIEQAKAASNWGEPLSEDEKL